MCVCVCVCVHACLRAHTRTGCLMSTFSVCCLKTKLCSVKGFKIVSEVAQWGQSLLKVRATVRVPVRVSACVRAC